MWEWVLQRFGKRMSAFGIFVSEAGSKAWRDLVVVGEAVTLEPKPPGGRQGRVYIHRVLSA